MAKDFKAGQVKTSKIIGKDGEKTVFLRHTDSPLGEGAHIVPEGGSDVAFVFAGTPDDKLNEIQGVTLFNGDIVVSGTLYAENQVIDLETTTDSGLTISGGTPLIAGSGTTEVAIHINTADEGAIMWDDGDALIYEFGNLLKLESVGGIELNPAAGIVSIGADTRLDSTAGSTQYFNFGDTDGSSGYGIRSNAGAIEFKDNAGAWAGVGSGGSMTSIDTRVLTEESARASDDTSLQTRLAAEEAAHLADSGSLQTRLAAEEAAHLADSGSLQTRLAAEEAALGAEILATNGDVGSIDTAIGLLGPGGLTGTVQINDGGSGFEGAAHLKYDPLDNRVWLGSGVVPSPYNAKLHITSEFVAGVGSNPDEDDAPALRIETKSGVVDNPYASLLIDHSCGLLSGKKIVKIDANAVELFTIDNDGLVGLTAAAPKLIINSTGATDEALIKLTDTSTAADGSLIQTKLGDLLIANSEDAKITEIVGKYGGAAPKRYNIIRGEVGVVNKPTVMIQTDPLSLTGKPADAIASNDINLYVEGVPGSLGSASDKGSSQFGGDVQVDGCVARGGILQLSLSVAQGYSITNTGPYVTSMDVANVASIVWDTSIITDTNFYSWSGVTGEDITITKAGIYKISYSVNLSQITPADGRINMRTFLRDTASATVLTAIDCSEAWSYGRGSGAGSTVSKMTNVCTTTYEFAANDVFNLNMVFLHGASGVGMSLNVRAGQTWILIERIA
jgi:hypothetical protein